MEATPESVPRPPPGPWRLWVWMLVIDAGYVVLSPVLFVVFLILSRFFTRPKYTRGWRQKLGGVPVRVGRRPCFWIHAVSVGEVQTALPLIVRLEEVFPDWEISLSVSTPTGFDVATRKLTGRTVFYAPIDFGPVLSRVFRRRRPTAVLLIELELWPRLLVTSKLRGVPVFVANGRLSARSFRRYALGGPLARGLFSLVEAYGVQTTEYEERFRRLGVDPSSLAVLGNLKHDGAPASPAAQGQEIRDRFYLDSQLVVVAGSTHPGEEAILCRLYDAWRRESPGARLVLAPRHIDRVDAAELARWGATSDFVLWSQMRSGMETAGDSQTLGETILIVDTLGELEKFYFLADVVFVGGTLVPHGGHNLFEAARLKKPVVFGRHFENFREEADLLLASKAAICVRDEADLGRTVGGLLRNAMERAELGKKAGDATLALEGATQRHVDWLKEQLRLFFP